MTPLEDVLVFIGAIVFMIVACADQIANLISVIRKK